VAPTFSRVVVSDMFESPTMTCRRRYFSASACGSSRVLMIGRERVVALETPSQMWIGALGEAEHGPARGLKHLAGTDDELAGDEERDQHLGQPVELPVSADQVVLVAAVGVARRVGVVLEQEDLPRDALLVEAPLGVDEQALEDPLPPGRGRPSWRTSSHSAVAYSGWEPTSGTAGAPLRRKTLLDRPTRRPCGTGSGRLVGGQLALAPRRRT
jgi:hypothetical protein